MSILVCGNYTVKVIPDRQSLVIIMEKLSDGSSVAFIVDSACDYVGDAQGVNAKAMKAILMAGTTKGSIQRWQPAWPVGSELGGA